MAQVRAGAGARVMRPLLFLDFDGVLCVPDGPRRRGQWWFCPKRVALLQGIIDRTNCEIVISSTWRQIHEMDELRRWLHEAGLRHPIRDRTPSYGLGPERGHEIQAWLNDNYPDARHPPFIILDDSDDMVHLSGHLVLTGWREGLTREKADEVVRRMFNAMRVRGAA